jgi:beta-mannosidase
VAVQVPARGHLSLPVLDALPGFMDLTGAYQFGPAAQDLVVAQWVIKGEAEAEKEAEKESVQALYFDPAQMLQFNGSPGLSAQSQRCADGSVEVRISTRAAAYGVHFESPGWQPSDEFFHLPPGGHRTVLFKTNTRLQGEQKRPAHWYATVCALNVRQTYPVLDKES